MKIEFCRYNDREYITKDVCVRTWRIDNARYTNNNPSVHYDFTTGGENVRVIDVRCADLTGDTSGLTVTIIRNTEEECEKEFWGQYYDGLFEKHGYIKKKEIKEV